MCDLDTFHAFPWVSSNPVQMKRCRELKPNAMHLHLYQIHNRYEKQRLLKSHTYVWNVDRRPTDSCLVYTYLKIMKNDQQSWENIFSMIQGYFLLSVSSLSEAPFTVQHIYLITPPPTIYESCVHRIFSCLWTEIDPTNCVIMTVFHFESFFAPKKSLNYSSPFSVDFQNSYSAYYFFCSFRIHT